MENCRTRLPRPPGCKRSIRISRSGWPGFHSAPRLRFAPLLQCPRTDSSALRLRLAVFESLNGQIKKSLDGRGGPGMFSIPGLLKVRVVKKPARKARMGVNPFTGEEMMFKAKPASKVVKATILKGLKDMV